MKRKGLKLRKLLAVIMVLCLAVGLLAVPDGSVVVKAEEEETYEYNGFIYRVFDNNTIIFDPNGNEIKNAIEIIGYSGSDIDIIIPSEIGEYKVIRIGDGAFYGSNSSSITILEGVIHIGDRAFAECNSLNEVIIPDSVRYIGSRAFLNCNSLNSIIIPKYVTHINFDTFENCSSLSSITLPDNIICIKSCAFAGCSSLSNIVMNDGITEIGREAFRGCSKLSSIIIPKSVLSIEYGTFDGCSSLSIVEIQDGVASIGDVAFRGCSNLKSIIIPNSVTSIGVQAFDSCSSLNNVVISGNVKQIAHGTFDRCSNLSNIILSEGITNIGGRAFAECSSLSNVILPDSVIEIGGGAFWECSNLRSITIPEGVDSVNEGTFLGCSNLSSVAIPKSVTGIGAHAFENCISLSNIIIPEGVTHIGEKAFMGCSSLSNITLPNGITDIGERGFYGCNFFNSITIPNSVLSMGKFTFSKCYNLEKITNNSEIVIDLFAINMQVQWYDAATGEPIDKLGTGTAIALPKPTELKKSDITLDNGSYFVDKHGNKVDTDNVIIVKSSITQKQEDIIQAVEEITQNAAEKSRVFYYDISAYINAIGGEPAVLSGNITIKLDYPSGVTKDHDIVVLHNTLRLEDVKKYDSYFTFETDGFSPFTVIALEAGTPSDNTAVRDFVNRLYTLVLAREAEEAGLESWTNALVTGESSGVDAGYGFVFSDECKEKNLSNDDFVEILYNTFMNRASDEGGKTAWVSQLNAGVEREKVFEGFIYSAEFADICADYGINVGSTSDVGALVNALTHYRNQNADITKFVARCYTEAMGREYEPDGLEAWCKVIIEKSNTPKQVAQNFIFSEEFTIKNLSDEEYVQVLYRTFMGREADEGGLAAWVNVLESGREDRAKVLEGFSDSVEFDGILQSFGLN